MGLHGKKYISDKSKIDRTRKYSLDEALTIINQFEKRKFDESVDIVVRLNVDPKQSDQMVRGAVTLPHGTGKNVRVLVIVKGEAEREARENGADYVGSDDLIEKISAGWTDFDRVLTTPDGLKDLSKVAKILGPKGLMPNKKTGTVTQEIGKAVKEQKLGKVEFKIDKASIVHAMVGKRSFGSQKLKENILAFYSQVLKAKPAAAKGVYVKKVSLSTSMGPGIFIDPISLESLTKGI